MKEDWKGVRLEAPKDSSVRAMFEDERATEMVLAYEI